MLQLLKQFVSTYNVPSAHEVRWVLEDVKHSPDFGYLEQYEFQLLFCPDEVQRGFHHYSLIEDSSFVCTAYTRKAFNYWQERQQSADSIPIPMMAYGPTVGNLFPPALPVKGELHAIRPYQFKDLDNHKQNRVQFLRKRVQLVVPYREFQSFTNNEVNGKPLPYTLAGKKVYLSEEKVHLVKAWMYVGNPEYWDDLLDAGFNSHPYKAVRHHQSRRPWLERYYSYTREGT